MNFASSRTAYEMSGLVVVERYMTLPTSAAYGTDFIASRSASVFGQESVVRMMCDGSGVDVVLHVSMLKSRRIEAV